MPFQPGNSGNSKGRPKGTKNRSTQEMRESIHGLISSNFSKRKIAEDLSALEPKYRLQVFLKLLDFVVPKPTGEAIKEESPRNNHFLNIWQQMQESCRIDNPNNHQNDGLKNYEDGK